MSPFTRRSRAASARGAFAAACILLPLVLGACGGHEPSSPAGPGDAAGESASGPEGSDSPAPTLRELTRAALQAHEQGDFATFLEKERAASALVPAHPGLLYNVACGLALTGDAEGSLSALNRLAGMGLSFDVAADGDLASLRGPRLDAIAERFRRNREPVVRSSVALRLDEKDFLPEGVAWDPVTRSIFVSSVHRGVIVRSGPGGKTSELPPPSSDTRLGIQGMKVDAGRRRLWAGASSLPEVEGFTKEMKGRAAVLMYDLDHPAAPVIFDSPGDGAPHAFGDLALDPDGGVYVTDSFSPVVFRIPAGATAMESWLRTEPYASLQGLAFTPDGSELIVADYTRGLFAVSIASREIRPLPGPENAALAGIDGLYLHDGSLIGIQNGVRPHRVVRLRADAGLGRIVSLEVLEQGHPEYAEPTLGVVVGGDLLYVANSQWERFGGGASGGAGEAPAPPVILRL
ncbi:MAG TPA: hypothetical protein VNI57_11910, partial [Candidatus Saccharimonadales bacterium]|nr:hypothetical protein [Candidatus Saccharimonadales bacterium]